MIHRLIWISAYCLIGTAAYADTLVQMPPASWHECRPLGRVTIKHHVGYTNCDGEKADSCTRQNGDQYVIDMRSDVSKCVYRKLLEHEKAHTCGWDHEAMRMERCP
jgi:hypothetical protein